MIWLHANAQTEQTFPSEIEAWMWFPYAYRWNLVKYEATHTSSVFDIIWLQSFGKGYLNLTEMEIDIPQRGAKIGLTPRVFQVLIQPSIPRLAHLFICTLGCIHCSMNGNANHFTLRDVCVEILVEIEFLRATANWNVMQTVEHCSSLTAEWVERYYFTNPNNSSTVRLTAE